MTRKSNKQRRSQGGSSSSAGFRQLHQDMKELLELQKTQESKFVPEVPDVPRLRFRADQLINVELSYRGSQNTSTTAPTYGALAFSLASSPNFGNYTACFDLYRIIQVNVKFFPTGPVNTQEFISALDYDDANALTSPTSILSYNTMKVSNLNQIDERTLVPRFATAAYAGATFNGYANASPSTFIDAASPGVQYYGVKYYAPTTPANVVAINYIVTMMIQFKNQRAT